MHAEHMGKHVARLFQLDTVIRGVLPLGLLDSERQSSWMALQEFCKPLSDDEFKAALVSHRGYLVAGAVQVPENIRYSNDGIVVAYRLQNRYYPVLAYGETFDDAFEALLVKAVCIRKQALSAIRHLQAVEPRRYRFFSGSASYSGRHKYRGKPKRFLAPRTVSTAMRLEPQAS